MVRVFVDVWSATPILFKSIKSKQPTGAFSTFESLSPAVGGARWILKKEQLIPMFQEIISPGCWAWILYLQTAPVIINTVLSSSQDSYFTIYSCWASLDPLCTAWPYSKHLHKCNNLLHFPFTSLLLLLLCIFWSLSLSTHAFQKHFSSSRAASE